MADAKVFRMGTGLTLEDVAHALEDFLRTQKRLETEGVRQSGSTYFIQARQTESWRKFVGMDQAIQVRLVLYGDMLTVDLGAGRWVDKLGAATVGYIVFAPLMLTAAIGAIGQQKLPQEIFDFVQRYTFLGKPLDINDFREPAQPEAPAAARCAACGMPLPEGAKFCPGCGMTTTGPKLCQMCGAVLPKGAKFCANCGTAVN